MPKDFSKKITNITRIVFVLVAIMFFASLGIVSAEEPQVEIKDVEIQKNADSVEISATLFNPSENMETSPFTYLIMLESSEPLIEIDNSKVLPPTFVSSAQEGSDYFSLKPMEKKKVTYSLPISRYLPQVEYVLRLKLILPDGEVLGSVRKIIDDLGSNTLKNNSYQDAFLEFDLNKGCSIVTKEGKEFLPSAGPIFDPGISPEIRCHVKNLGDKEVEVSSKITWKEFYVYGRPADSQKQEETNKIAIKFKPNEEKVLTASLPSVDVSQVYQALWSFEDTLGNARSFYMPFRWTIGGSSARVEKISMISPIKAEYKKNETVSLSVDYFGSMDLYWASEDGEQTSALSDLKMSALVKNSDGEICGSETSTLQDIGDPYLKKQIVDVVLTRKCKDISYEAMLVSGDDELASQSALAPRIIKKSGLFAYKNIIWLLALVFCIFIFVLILRKKKVIKNISLIFFAILLSSSIVFAETREYTGDKNSSGWGGLYSGSADKLFSYYMKLEGGGLDSEGENQIKYKNLEVDFDRYFNEDKNPRITMDYAIKQAERITGCSNWEGDSHLYKKIKVQFEADGVKNNVKFRIGSSGSFDDEAEVQDSYLNDSNSYGMDKTLKLEIKSSEVAGFYNSDGRLKANLKVIVTLKVVGQAAVEDDYTNGHEAISGAKGVYANSAPAEGSPYYKGSFTKFTPSSDAEGSQLIYNSRGDSYGYASYRFGDYGYGDSKSDAFSDSDVIKFIIPLELPDPSADLSLSGTSPIDYNCKPTLSWTVNDIDSCSASGGWSGSKTATDGTYSETMASGITAATTYGLSCSAINNTYTYTDSVTVSVNAKPTVDLQVGKNGSSISYSNGPLTLNSGEEASLKWTTTGTTGYTCTATGGWSGNNKSASGGTETTGSISSGQTYTITCSNSCGYSVTDTVEVNIDTIDSIIQGDCGYPLSKDYCASGDFVDLDDTTTTYEWKCEGSGAVAGGSAISAVCSLPMTCSDRIKNQDETGIDTGGVCSSITNDACGDAAGGTYSLKPTSNLCDSGTVPSISENNDIWGWQCPSSGGGQGGSCTASRDTITLALAGDGGGTISARLYSTDSDLIVTKTSGQGGVTSNKTINCYYSSDYEPKSACKFEVSTAGTVTVKEITAAEEISTSSFSQWGTGNAICDGDGCSVCNSLTKNGGCSDFTLTERGDANIIATFSSGGGGDGGGGGGGDGGGGGGGQCNYDGSQNNGESGVDCGGGDCPACSGDPLTYYTLTVSIDGTGEGTVSGNGIDCSTNDTSGCSVSIAQGTSVSLTADPGSNSEFSTWVGSVCDGSSSNPCAFVMNSETSLTATFNCENSSCNPDPFVPVPEPTGGGGYPSGEPDGPTSTSVDGACGSTSLGACSSGGWDGSSSTEDGENYSWTCSGSDGGSDSPTCYYLIGDGDDGGGVTLTDFTLTVEGESLSATIIDDLPADSNEIEIKASGTCDDIALTVLSPIGTVVGPSPENISTDSTNNISKLSIKSITSNGTYTVTVDGASSSGRCNSFSLPIDLTVEKITTRWEEF